MDFLYTNANITYPNVCKDSTDFRLAPAGPNLALKVPGAWALEALVVGPLLAILGELKLDPTSLSTCGANSMVPFCYKLHRLQHTVDSKATHICDNVMRCIHKRKSYSQ